MPREQFCVLYLDDGLKLRTAAAIYNIKPNALFYRVKKYKENVIPRIENFNKNLVTSKCKLPKPNA